MSQMTLSPALIAAVAEFTDLTLDSSYPVEMEELTVNPDTQQFYTLGAESRIEGARRLLKVTQYDTSLPCPFDPQEMGDDRVLYIDCDEPSRVYKREADGSFARVVLLRA